MWNLGLQQLTVFFSCKNSCKGERCSKPITGGMLWTHDMYLMPTPKGSKKKLSPHGAATKSAPAMGMLRASLQQVAAAQRSSIWHPLFIISWSKLEPSRNHAWASNEFWRTEKIHPLAINTQELSVGDVGDDDGAWRWWWWWWWWWRRMVNKALLYTCLIDIYTCKRLYLYQRWFLYIYTYSYI